MFVEEPIRVLYGKLLFPLKEQSKIVTQLNKNLTFLQPMKLRLLHKIVNYNLL